MFRNLKIIIYLIFLSSILTPFKIKGQTKNIISNQLIYNIEYYRFNSLIIDMYLSPHFGMFVSSGGKLYLIDGKTKFEINHKISKDNISSGIVRHFKREPKHVVFYKTDNYIYRLSDKIDTLPIKDVDSPKYYYNLSQFNKHQRAGNYHHAPEKEDLAGLIYKKKSGLVVGRNEIKYYNHKNGSLRRIHEFPPELINYYINFDDCYYIFTSNYTYKVTIYSQNKIITQRISDPINGIRNGRIFNRHNKFYLIDKNGLHIIHKNNEKLFLETIIASNKVFFPKDAVYFEISEDQNDLFFCESNSSEIIHYRKQNSIGIKMASLNSILVYKDKIYTNNQFCYNYSTNLIKFDSLLGAYNNDYSQIGKNKYITNNKNHIIHYFDDNLVLKKYSITRNLLWARFINYKGKIYSTHPNEIFTLDNNGNKNKLPIKENKNRAFFNFCYALIAKDNKIYLATDRGLLVYNLLTYDLCKYPGLEIENFRTIKYLESINSIIAFSYGNGPYILKDEKAHKLALDAKKELLFSHNIIIKDSLAYISSNSGLFITHFNKWLNTMPNNSINFYKLDTIDGLPSNECNSGSVNSMVYDTARNCILVSTIKGLGIIPLDIKHIQWPKTLPKIIKTKFAEQEFFGCKDTINNYSNLEFTISVPYFGNPINASVEYKINGVFDNWSKLNDGKILLPDKLYGNYIIELRVNNDFGNFLVRNYYIYIKPKWYQTEAFKLVLIGFLLLFLIATFISIRVYEKNKRKKIQMLVDQKTEDLRIALIQMKSLNNELTKSEQIKEDLVNVLAHDMKSPLRSISFTVDYLIKTETKIEKDRIDILYDIKSSINQLSEFSTEFLKWYASSKAGFKVNRETIKLNEIIQPTINIYDIVIKRSRNEIKVNIQKDIWVFVDKELFKIVFRNLLDNANKYCDGLIIVETQFDNGILILNIKNNINKETKFNFDYIREKLNYKDDTVDGNFKFGLTLIKKMAFLSEIGLSVEHKDNFLTFSLKLPIKPTIFT